MAGGRVNARLRGKEWADKALGKCRPRPSRAGARRAGGGEDGVLPEAAGKAPGGNDGWGLSLRLQGRPTACGAGEKSGEAAKGWPKTRSVSFTYQAADWTWMT